MAVGYPLLGIGPRPLHVCPRLAARSTRRLRWTAREHSIVPFDLSALPLAAVAAVFVTHAPMWSPVQTKETQAEIDPEEEPGSDRESTASLWRRFCIHGGVTALAGYMIGEASVALVDQTDLSETAIGTTFAAISNSLPELVTAIAAVRRGAVNLAVGDIIGGNSFEVLFLAAADIFYREGSIYHAFTRENVFTAVLAILMTGVLLLGMLRRERYGVVGIGFESAIILLLYAGSLVLVFV
jgi:cation:H+ antiporter